MHLMTIEGYAIETLPMEDDPASQKKLERLGIEALHYRLSQEKVLCNESEQVLEGMGEWARKQRKEFELHCLTCELEKAGREAGTKAEQTP